ncbi:hypothetical protein D6853_08245 [Butyrivibrio sp. X503]|uniref:hypothetical protein n=1 Tax=Butyrivibrio sp. X503 TaxID=2364878 RepID=UPI000EA9DDDB|nr:hypothetical protein [Butyrivibrio sp. X503]RKM55540.1 hypothetical protein D6853_08245 [Butyrivibrio sp. X503]
MKKRGTKLFTILLTAGMLAFTAASGISANMITSTKTTVYQMEKNDSAFVDGGGMTGKIFPDRKWLSDVESKMSKGNGYVRVKLNGYSKPVLLEASKKYIEHVGDSKGNSRNASRHVWVYTESSNRNAKCIGTLISDDYIGVKNGMIYARSGGTIETYLVSADGERLVQKDYADINTKLGFTNSSNKGTGYKSVNGYSAEKLYYKLLDEFWGSTIHFKIR